MFLPNINFLHLTVSEIQVQTNFFLLPARLPSHPDTMGENHTPTALKGCGVKNRPAHRRTDVNLYSPERQLNKASEPLFDLEGGAKGQV